ARIDVELELSWRRLVVPALDRYPEALESLQHDIDEPKLLTGVEVEIAEWCRMRHRGEVAQVLGASLRVRLLEQHHLDLEGSLGGEPVRLQPVGDLAQLRPRTHRHSVAV